MDTVVVIDDKQVFLNRWKNLFSGQINVDLKLFTHPLEFLMYCEENNGFPGEIDYLITDKKTPGFDVISSDFIRSFKKEYKDFSGLTFLSTSLFDKSVDPLKIGFDAVIPKRALLLNDLERS